MTIKLKTFFNILIAFALINSGVLSSYAYVMSHGELEEIIKQQVKVQAKSYIDKKGGGEIEVKILNLPVDTVSTKGANPPKVYVYSSFDKYQYRDIKRVVVREGSRDIKSFPVNVNVLVYRNVLTAINPIYQFDTITPKNIAIVRKEVGLHLDEVIESYDYSHPLVATRNFAKGNVILKSYTKSKPDIIKDASVNIIFASNKDLKIEMDGKALRQGNVGDMILVKSLKYNKVYSGTITAENEVMVKI